MTRFRLNGWRLSALLIFASAALSRAEILYVRPQGTGTAQVNQLRKVNPNGAGDQAVPLVFPNLFLPTWAHDGSVYALTAVNPQRPGLITLNAFTVNPKNGAFVNVTKLVDEFSDKGYSYKYALYKAFSPDRQLMAVNSVYRTGSDSTHESGTPILQIFKTDGSGSVAIVHAGAIRDNVHHDGEGVDWSPNANIVVTPVKYDAPLQSGGGVGEATALFLAQPVTNAGNARQLTFPNAGHVDNGPFGEHILWAEHDYAPKFSPDGNFVAYVHSYQKVSSLRIVPDPNVESLRIVNVQTSKVVQVTKFAAGMYITSLDWSPDGTRLVFDKGKQAISSGVYLQGAQPELDRLFIINRNGSGLRQLRGAGACTPAWRPAAANNLAMSEMDSDAVAEE